MSKHAAPMSITSVLLEQYAVDVYNGRFVVVTVNGRTVTRPGGQARA